MKWCGVLICLLLSAACLPVSAALPPGFEEVNDHTFRIGGVTLDKLDRSVRFPATVNLREGAIEYFLVHESGKAYESLFTTKVNPYDIHLAMLLLGVKAPTEVTEAPPEQITMDTLKSSPAVKGDAVEVSVFYKNQKLPAENFILNTQEGKEMTRGPWAYTSSVLYKGQFLAKTEGSIIALVTDPAALINNPRPGHDNDLIWNIATEKVPPAGTAVEICIQLKSELDDRKANQAAGR